MELVLHARDVREATGVQQVLEGDVAQANRRDQPVVAGRGHRGQLVIEEPVGPGRAHQPQVDDWQRVEIESPQVVLYAALQLVRASAAKMPPFASRLAPTLLTMTNCGGGGGNARGVESFFTPRP